MECESDLRYIFESKYRRATLSRDYEWNVVYSEIRKISEGKHKRSDWSSTSSSMELPTVSQQLIQKHQYEDKKRSSAGATGSLSPPNTSRYFCVSLCQKRQRTSSFRFCMGSCDSLGKHAVRSPQNIYRDKHLYKAQDNLARCVEWAWIRVRIWRTSPENMHHEQYAVMRVIVQIVPLLYMAGCRWRAYRFLWELWICMHWIN
jgi:hypothetical protein